MIEDDNGSLTWTPKIVIFEGKKYKAPLDLTKYFAYKAIKEILIDRKNNRC